MQEAIAGEPVRVLIVDDSLVVREVITELLSQQPDIQVVGSAADPYEAREQIKRLQPDVLTLDIEMPRMDGLTFLRNLMRLNPLPVVMLSSLTHDGAEATLQALESGAVDFIAKPGRDSSDRALEHFAEQLQQKVRTAASVSARLRSRALRARRAEQATPSAATAGVPAFAFQTSLIAIGASTGGTEALRELLQALPAAMPPILVTQHIPAGFSARFARRLDDCCRLRVHEAVQGECLEPGHVYIAPGDRHLRPVQAGGSIRIELDDGAPVNRHKPSVDAMLESVYRLNRPHSAVVMLTGMGEDGARMMTQCHAVGMLTIAQDQASSLVWGMPGAVVRRNGAARVLPLNQIAGALMAHCYTTG